MQTGDQWEADEEGWESESESPVEMGQEAVEESPRKETDEGEGRLEEREEND